MKIGTFSAVSVAFIFSLLLFSNLFVFSVAGVLHQLID